MSIQVVTYSQVKCDSCGRCWDCVESDSTSARIGASRAGWKYVSWDLKGKGYQTYKRAPGPSSEPRQTVPKQWDCCPDCPLPESPPEAAKIRESRMTRNSRGQWVEKESV